MKNHLTLSAFLFLFITATLPSCKDKETCPCQNGGTCNGGTCVCAAGYGGDNCDHIIRDKIIATYNAQFYSGGTCANGIFEISIESSNLGLEYVVIRNLDANGTDVFATVVEYTDSYYITIPQQVTANGTFGGSVTIEKPGLTGNDNYNYTVGCAATITLKP
jgi:hypothetical protein